MKSVRAIVSGKVQGVFFRAATQEKAEGLDVRGYVKNLPDGTVEIVAVGDDERVEALMEWASSGPPGARVKKVETEEFKSTQEFGGFRVAY